MYILYVYMSCIYMNHLWFTNECSLVLLHFWQLNVWNIYICVCIYNICSCTVMLGRMRVNWTSVLFSKLLKSKCPLYPLKPHSVSSNRLLLFITSLTFTGKRSQSLSWRSTFGSFWRTLIPASTRRSRFSTASLTCVACWNDSRRWRSWSPKPARVREREISQNESLWSSVCDCVFVCGMFPQRSWDDWSQRTPLTKERRSSCLWKWLTLTLRSNGSRTAKRSNPLPSENPEK